jgi:hypothetical protein
MCANLFFSLISKSSFDLFIFLFIHDPFPNFRLFSIHLMNRPSRFLIPSRQLFKPLLLGQFLDVPAHYFGILLPQVLPSIDPVVVLQKWLFLQKYPDHVN